MSDFPFEYAGGGWFRRKGMPKGQPAETLHGMQAVEAAVAPLDNMVTDYGAKLIEWQQLTGFGSPSACAAELARLRRGDFTPEEFQALCHHRDEKPGCTFEDFAQGCEEYQKKLFGKSRP